MRSRRKKGLTATAAAFFRLSELNPTTKDLSLSLSRSTRMALVSFGVHTRSDNSRIWTTGANSIHDRLSLAHELLISLIYIMFHRDVSFVRCGEFPFAPPTGSNAIEFSRVSPDQIASAR